MTKEVLVVDDDSSLGRLLVRTLERAGIQALTVATGKEAIDRAASNPDLILVLDQRLPDMTGRDIALELKGKNLANPFIMMTGQGDERLAVEMMKLGAADYLLKDTQLMDRLPATLTSLFHHLEVQARLQAAEEEIKKRLIEKELLLREIHHRVKNNLTVISSLLNLQAAAITSPEAAMKAFEKSRDRVLAMALVHEKLYESADFTGITLQGYLENLTSQLIQAYAPDGQTIIKITADDILFDIEQAIPIGLILNELVSNALLYAFPQKQVGHINIQLRRLNQDQAELTVSDDGIGLPEGCIDNDGLGLTLVKLLVDQLGGTLAADSAGGACFRLVFPVQSRLKA